MSKSCRATFISISELQRTPLEMEPKRSANTLNVSINTDRAKCVLQYYVIARHTAHERRSLMVVCRKSRQGRSRTRMHVLRARVTKTKKGERERERESLRNRCPSGQKAFIVLFRYGRRHKRGRPNSYGCRFCNVRVRSPVERNRRPSNSPSTPALSPRSKSHETPTKHATSPRLYEPRFENQHPRRRRKRKKKTTRY